MAPIALNQKSIRYKLILLVTSLVAAISLGLALINLAAEFYRVKTEIRQEAISVTTALARAALPMVIARRVEALADIVSSFKGQPHVTHALIADSRGRVLAHTDSAQVGSLVPVAREPAGGEGRPVVREDLRKELLEVKQPVVFAGKRWGTVEVGYSLGALKAKLQSLVVQTLITTGIFVGIGLWITLVLSQYLTQPLRELVAAARSLEKGEFDIKVEEGPFTEIDQLKRQFVEMAGALKRSQHELRETNEQLRLLNDELEVRVRRATAELAETKDYLGSILASTQEAILSTDREGLVKTYNEAACHLLGWSDDDMVGRPLHGLYEGAPRLDGERWQEVLEGKPVSHDAWVEIGRGERRFLKSNFSSLRDQQGEVIGIVAVIEDLTERKRYEEEIQRSERLASAGELAAGIAHEINNRLAIISGFADIMRRSAPPGAGLEEDIESIRQEARRGKEIVQQLLRFARPAEPKVEETDLHHCLDRSLNLLAHEVRKKDLRVARRYDPGLPPVPADAAQMEQVFTNILLNAVQALPPSGRLEVRTRAEPAGAVVVEIWNDGPPIAPEILPRMFDPFFTTKGPSEGTGLGLSIALKIVEKHGGRLSVDSHAAEGTCFSIRLPLKVGPASERRSEAATVGREDEDPGVSGPKGIGGRA